MIPRRQQIYIGGLESSNSGSQPSKTSGGNTNTQVNSEERLRVQELISRHTKSLKSSRKAQSKPKDNEEADFVGPAQPEEDEPLSSRSRDGNRSRSSKSRKALIHKPQDSAKRMKKEKLKQQLGNELVDQVQKRQSKPAAATDGRGGLRSFIS